MADNPSLHVFMVDDDLDDRIIFSNVLDQLGIKPQITFAKQANEFFTLLKDGIMPDVIFLDINMPIMNGKQVLRDLKSNPEYSSIPVIIISASKYEKDIEETFETGAHYYLVKPYTNAYFLEAMKRIFVNDWKAKPL